MAQQIFNGIEIIREKAILGVLVGDELERQGRQELILDPADRHVSERSVAVSVVVCGHSGS
ncbi:MAG: hypothetical protein Q8M18_21745 [Bradyrhizobium sp.]|nr:hypothetical protein [Bradyrhizobium sp.]